MNQTPSQQLLIKTQHDDWVELKLNRPDKLNALSAELLLELKRGVIAACADRANRVVLLTGEGRGFCVGQDLNERDTDRISWPPPIAANIRELYAPIINAITDASMPVVCAVNGVAAGAGANLALACDIVIAKQSMNFIQSFARIGLMPDAAGSWILPRIVGLARAKAMAMLAEPVTAEQAQAAGMIWRAVPDQEFDAEIRKTIDLLRQHPKQGLSATKRAMNVALENELPAHLELEAKLQDACGQTEDYRLQVTRRVKSNKIKLRERDG